MILAKVSTVLVVRMRNEVVAPVTMKLNIGTPLVITDPNECEHAQKRFLATDSNNGYNGLETSTQKVWDVIIESNV